MSGAMLIDTGPIVAMLNPAEQHHETCVEIFRAMDGPLLTCWPVITEAMWLLRKSPVGQIKLLEALEIGAIQLLTIDQSSAPTLKALFNRYKTLRANRRFVSGLPGKPRENTNPFYAGPA